MIEDNREIPVISAFITNLGKYNEGELVGKWHDFPTTKEEIMQTFKEIGIDGVHYEEFFITDYDTNNEGIYDILSEYENIDELNYFASRIQDMSDYELGIFEAAVMLGDYCGSVQTLINLIDNLDCFDFISGVENDYDLGYYWVEESGCYDTKNLGHLTNYIDYEQFGRDICLDEGGIYTTEGYISSNGNPFCEEYDGIHVPDEYKVFSTLKQELSVLTKSKRL